MQQSLFQTPDGQPVTALTAEEMRDVDRVAVEEIGLTLPRMMEHAGRSLALEALGMADDADEPIVVLAGGGGNGGGGLVCARNLANRSRSVTVVLDREPSELSGVSAEQCAILREMETVTGPIIESEPPAADAPVVVDALLGYGLSGAPRGRAAELIEWTASTTAPILSLDVPSGVDATTGDRPGVAVEPAHTLTLALPKTGLAEIEGSIALADLSIPAVVYDRLDIPYEPPFGGGFTVALTPA